MHGKGEKIELNKDCERRKSAVHAVFGASLMCQVQEKYRQYVTVRKEKMRHEKKSC